MVFVIGEALLQRLFYGATWSETMDAAAESAAVLTISAGITWGVVALCGASGSWVGPIGVGVGVVVGSVAAFGKHVWYAGTHLFSAGKEVDEHLWNARKTKAVDYLQERARYHPQTQPVQ